MNCCKVKRSDLRLRLRLRLATKFSKTPLSIVDLGITNLWVISLGPTHSGKLSEMEFTFASLSFGLIPL